MYLTFAHPTVNVCFNSIFVRGEGQRYPFCAKNIWNFEVKGIDNLNTYSVESQGDVIAIVV